MDEAATHATVSVRERMDRLELGVDDRRLDDRGQVIPGGEEAEIRHQARNSILWWGNEVCVLRRTPAPNPALGRPKLSAKVPIGRGLEKYSVNV